MNKTIPLSNIIRACFLFFIIFGYVILFCIGLFLHIKHDYDTFEVDRMLNSAY